MRNRFDETLSLRASGHVRRWHTIRTITQQTVAEHSGQALTLLLQLHPDPSFNLIRALLWHDSAERVVGDVPSPALRADIVYRDAYEHAERVVFVTQHPSAIMSLTSEETLWLRAVDRLEAFLHAREEFKLGNSEFHNVWRRLHSALLCSETPPQVIEFLNWFMTDGDKRSLA